MRRAALAVVLVALAGCAGQPDATSASAGLERPRAVFFGSSTSAGAGASCPERGWTAIAARRLGWIDVNRGVSGSTLAERGGPAPSAETRWREAIVHEDPDVVVVMYGANDVDQEVPLGDPETPGTFRHAARAVLGGIRAALPSAVLVVCTPQPRRAAAAPRAPYDLALAEAASAAGALFVPAGEAFPPDRLEILSADALHLNDAGHAALAEFVASRIALALGPPDARAPMVSRRSRARARGEAPGGTPLHARR